MAGYFGTEVQQQLQARAQTAVAFVRQTPGACQAGRTMGEIVQSVREVTDQLSLIAAASAEQLEGIRQVGDAITRMEQTTQQNAGLVEESASAADRMAGEAERLMAAVSRFRMPDGDAPRGRTPGTHPAEAVTDGVRPGGASPGLENLRGVVGEPRALAAHERHVARVRPALEAVDHVGEA